MLPLCGKVTSSSVDCNWGLVLPQLNLVKRSTHATGVPFDRAFLTSSIQTLSREINFYEQAAWRGRSAAVRSFSRSHLAALTQLLVTALQLRETGA